MARREQEERRPDTRPGGRRLFGNIRGFGDGDLFGRFTEWVARAMGTPWFLASQSVFIIAWMLWNSYAPAELRFDRSELGFTALTLVLSLQAAYAAPLILLAQNRQDDRDRVQIEQDRQRAERNLADTEYLAREVVDLRLAIKELASRDFIRSEMRAALDEVLRRSADNEAEHERLDSEGSTAPDTTPRPEPAAGPRPRTNTRSVRSGKP